jgi:pimeloyl-ACP methyl ester carboxylesterase
MKEIYLLSGLGADKRVFDFLDLSDFNINYINWIDPGNNESIEDYASRISKQINSANPVLIGVSFGGMIAIEIGKNIEVDKIVLISSAQSKQDIPFVYRFIGQLNLNKLIPTSLLKNVNFLTYWFFGVKNQTEKALLKSIIKDTDANFLRWAIDKIVNWNNVSEVHNIIAIHGDSDRILPIQKPDYEIAEGGHLMIINKASEVSRILKKCIG